MTREEAKAKAAKSIDEMYNKLEALDAKKEILEDKAKKEYAEMRENMMAKKVDLEVYIKEVDAASDDAFDELKVAFGKSSEAFKEAFGNIKSRFA